MIENDMNELRQGNRSALTNIYSETKRMVFSICYTLLRDYMLAEDMMQETYIKVAKNILQYNVGTNARAWINSIAKNTCLNEIKKRKKEVLTDFSARPDIEGGYSIKDYDESGIITMVIKHLDDKESKIVLMHTIGDMTFKEIAEVTNKSQGTVRWQYSNALRKLRKIIKREDLL